MKRPRPSRRFTAVRRFERALGPVAMGAVLLSIVVLATWALRPATGTHQTSGGPPTVATVSEPTTIAGGVSVDGARVDFGHVPLDTEVRHVFSVRNDGAAPVSFRPATVHVVEGCCPSTPALGAASLAPGDTTTLSMAMMMHVGMAGPHHFRLSLPVVTADGSSQPLEMHLFGHFG